MKKTLLVLITILLLTPLVVLAQAGGACDPSSPPSTGLCNPLGTSNSFQDVLTKLFAFVGTVIGMIAVTMIVYSGFRMIISRGEPEGLKTAKAGLTYAVIGLVVSVMAFGIVIAFQGFIGVQDDGNIVSGQINNPLKSNDLQGFITSTVQGFLGFVGVLAVIMIVYSGYLYVTSAGNEKQAEQGKSGLLWSVVGFLTILLAYVIINALKNVLD